MSDIATEVERREVTRLCHFTHLSSLAQIVTDEAILAAEFLVGKHPEAIRNDQYRLDGHLDYVSCSVQFPNLWVLDAYRNSRLRSDEWIVLLLKPSLLSVESTRFSPVNAATAAGAHVADGVEGFVAMYQPRPPSVHNIYRGPQHLKSCPTDNQAEVLVHRAVLIEEIRTVICREPAVQHQVDRLLDGCADHRPTTAVKRSLFDSDYVKQRIWIGYDMDLDDRDGDD